MSRSVGANYGDEPTEIDKDGEEKTKDDTTSTTRGTFGGLHSRYDVVVHCVAEFAVL